MKHRIGDMFGDWPENTTWLITTNAVRRRDGALVMGRGAALQAAQLWPDFPYLAGKRIQEKGTQYHLITRVMDIECGRHVGIFQVKFSWRDRASLALIEKAAYALQIEAAIRSDHTYRLNFPGIGNGRLAVSEVEPLLQVLPDNVEVWTLR